MNTGSTYDKHGSHERQSLISSIEADRDYYMKIAYDNALEIARKNLEEERMKRKLDSTELMALVFGFFGFIAGAIFALIMRGVLYG